MKSDIFVYMNTCNTIRDCIEKQSNFRECISPEERLAVTLRTKWVSNPWIKGSYCHITPECDYSDSGINKLAEPVYVEGVPRIILAGEAVHPSHYSTTHGAYESGQQQAALLHKYIMKEQINSSNK